MCHSCTCWHASLTDHAGSATFVCVCTFVSKQKMVDVKDVPQLHVLACELD